MAEKIILNVSGMTCNHCKMKVEKALKTLDGVEDVQINLDGGTADVSFDSGKVSADDLKAVIGDAGYDVK